MVTIYADFDTVDMAEFAARRLKQKVPDIKSVALLDNRHIPYYQNPGPTYFTPHRADGSMSFFPTPAYFMNDYEPYSSPWNNDIGYFEPQQRADTTLRVRVESDKLKACESTLRNMGGMKIEITDD